MTTQTDNSLKKPLLNEEKPQQPATKQVSFFRLFKFADGQDILLMIIGSIGALGSGAVMPLFSYVFGDVTLIYEDPDAIRLALRAAVKFFILGGGAFILNFLGIYCWSLSGQRQSVRYRKLYYQTVLNQQIKWYDGKNPNQLSTQITTQMTAIQGAIGQKVANVQTIFVMSILGFFLAYFRNWRLSLVLTATLPLLMIAGAVMMKAIQAMGQKNTKTFSQAGAIAEQAIGAIRAVKSLVGEQFQMNKFTNRLDAGKKQGQKYNVYLALSIGFIMLIFLGCYALAFWYGKVIILNFDYKISDVIAAFFCIIIGGSSISQATPALKNIGAGKAAAAKLFQLLQRVPTLIQKKNGQIINSIDQISLQNVKFSYKNDEQKNIVLQNFSLQIPKNKITAIVGESGSGKSTLVQLIQRFYDPLSGIIKVNGKDLKDLDVQTYRRQIGYVGQQPALFAVSIKQNLLFAKQNATDQQIIQSLKLANAYQFVQKLEKGINTFVGSSGAQVSGGQKQRIAIARAILKNPSLYIFDQATSALDRKNQKAIQQTLRNISSNHTTLIIAHRLSTIQHADNIVVLNKGRILQTGTHEQLFQKKSYYYDLIKNQIVSQQQNIEQIQQTNNNDNQINKTKILIEQKTQKTQNTAEVTKNNPKQNEVFSKLFKQSKSECIHYLIGSICAAINGTTFPLFSFVLSKLIVLMYYLHYPHQPKLQRQIDYYCIGFGGIAFLSALTTFIYNYCFGIIGQQLVHKLRIKLFNKLLRKEVKYYDMKQNNPGAISTKLAQDAYLLRNVTTNTIAVILLNLSTVGTGFILAFYYHWALTLIVLGLSPLLIIASSINMEKMKKFSQQAQQSYKQSGNLISDTVCNMRTVKSFGNTNTLLKKFDETLVEPYKIAKQKAFTNGFFQGVSQSMVMIVYGLIYYLAAVINTKLHKSSTDIFVSIFAIVFSAVGMGNNSRLVSDMAKAKAAGASIYQILQSKDQYEKNQQEGGKLKKNIEGKIEFKNVNFKYPSRQKIIFSNLNFAVQKNQKVGLVGVSGCGKSTIMQLLMRFYDIDSGQILVDDTNIKQYDLYHLRQQFGLVSQQPPLFIGNIENNIKYKNIQATHDQVVQAAKIADAHNFITQLSSEQYAKQVGTKGAQLSGGQKQRVAIARCILSHPKIYMFDQSTSALDIETQKTVFQNLKALTAGKTTLSIAHRISTIVDSHKILVFDDGKIIEEGTYEELSNLKGYFYRLERGQN